MTLRARLTTALEAADLSIVTDRGQRMKLTVDDATSKPPFARVRFGQASELGPQFRLGQMSVLIGQPYGACDPMRLLAAVYLLIDSTHGFEPLDVADLTDLPTRERTPDWYEHVITVASNIDWLD